MEFTTNIYDLQTVFLTGIVNAIRDAAVYRSKHFNNHNCKEYLARRFMERLYACNVVEDYDCGLYGKFGEFMTELFGDKVQDYESLFIKWLLNYNTPVNEIVAKLATYVYNANMPLLVMSIFNQSWYVYGEYRLCYTSDVRDTLSAVSHVHRGCDIPWMFREVRDKVDGVEQAGERMQSWTENLDIALCKYGLEFVYEDGVKRSTARRNDSYVSTRTRSLRAMAVPVNAFFVYSRNVITREVQYIMIPFDKLFAKEFYANLNIKYTGCEFCTTVWKFSMSLDSLHAARNAPLTGLTCLLSTYQLFNIPGARGSSAADKEVVTNMSVTEFRAIGNKDSIVCEVDSYGACDICNVDTQRADILRYLTLYGANVDSVIRGDCPAKFMEIVKDLRKLKSAQLNTATKTREMWHKSPVIATKYYIPYVSKWDLENDLNKVVKEYEDHRGVGTGIRIGIFSESSFIK